MKCVATNAYIILSISFLLTSCFQGDKAPLLQDRYLGQKPPGLNPEKFAPGVVSTPSIEFEPVFSTDGRTMLFTRFDEEYKATIMMTEYDGGIWSSPEVASFSGEYAEGSAFFSPDGNRIYYESMRPIPGSDTISEVPHLWYVENTSTGWSAPKHVGCPKGYIENWWNPTMAQDETIYFSYAGLEEKAERKSIFRTNLIDGEFTEPERLFEVSTHVNAVDAEPALAPDGTYIIFYSAGRPDQMGEGMSGDLYISFRENDGSWTQAQNMGTRINTVQEENWPVISPDGKYIFFSSNKDSKNGFPDIYWVDTRIVDELRPYKRE